MKTFDLRKRATRFENKTKKNLPTNCVQKKNPKFFHFDLKPYRKPKILQIMEYTQDNAFLSYFTFFAK